MAGVVSDLWRFLSHLVGGGGLLAQLPASPELSVLTTLANWLSVPVLLALGAGALRVWDRLNAGRTDTIGQLYKIIESKDADCAKIKVERDKFSERMSKYRMKIVEIQAQNNILIAANKAFAEGVDPLFVNRLITPQAFLIVDRTGIITDCDEDVRAILHYYKQEIVNHNVEMLIPEEFREAHRAFMAKILDETVPVDSFNVLSLVLLNREGVRVPVNIRIHRWRNRVGQLQFTTYIWERIPLPGTNGNGGGNGGSHSGDSGAFLKAGAPEASRTTAEMPTMAGAGPAKVEG